MLRISNSNFAGTTLPLLSESIPKVADIVVSKSEAETVSTLWSKSNKNYLKQAGITTVDNVT
jgi:hypothetical protein